MSVYRPPTMSEVWTLMLELALLTLSVLSDPANRARPDQAHAIATEADRASRRHGVPVALLVAVVLAESGGRNIISRRRRCGGRDAGVGQVHAHHDQRLRRLLTLSLNLDAAASILAASRARCARSPRWAACRRSEWGLYNAGSRTWGPRVLRVWRRLLERVSRGGLTT